jgi:DNA-binding NarL/FixJ family response regulator
MTIRILIVDDHALVRDGLRQLIDKEPSLVVVGQASNGEGAVAKLKSVQPDLLIVDLHMEGTQVISAAKSLCPWIRVVALTAYTSPSYVRSALSSGADGYVVKSESGESILRAIYCVTSGLGYLSPEVTQEVINGYVCGSVHLAQGPFASLTSREREIVNFITMGDVQNKSIANHLFLSERTVERHKTNIFRKLNVSSAQELLEKYAHNGEA